MKGILTRRGSIALLVTAAGLALLAPAWRPDALLVPGAYTGDAPTPALVPKALLLLGPLLLCCLGLGAFYRGLLHGRGLCLIAVLCSYLGVQIFGYLQSDGTFALQRRFYQASYGRDALLFDGFGELLTTYDGRHVELTGHGRTHPPGAAGLHWLTMRASTSLAQAFGPGEDPEYEAFVVEGWLGAFVWTGLQVLWLIPAWSLGRRLYGERVAATALVFGALAPSAIVIGPSVDALLPLFAASGLYALERGLDSGRYRWSLAAGFVSAGASLITWGFGMLAPLYLAYFLFRTKETGQRRWFHLPTVAAGGGLFLGTLFVCFGFNAFGPMANDLGTHFGHAAIAVRAYLPFLVISPLVFFLWAGMPISVGFFAAVLGSRPVRILRGERGDSLALATFLGLLVLTLSGATRGETERLWLPYLPFVALSGAHGLCSGLEGRPHSTRQQVIWCSMLLVTLISALLLGNWWLHHH